MTHISAEQDVVTLINVFTVSPEDRQRLVELLIEATEDVISRQPGYVSANIHTSLDGTQVTNYAQWRSREDFEAMLEIPEAQAHMREASKLAGIHPQLYEVACTHTLT